MECISGSKAYGLDTPDSDTDIKGVFLLPKSEYYGFHYIPQINNETNDIVYYELGRFMELLSVNNPNILELLSSPPSTIRYKHPFLNALSPELFLSKQCLHTFGKFAISQMKKARGLNKKIVNPISEIRKSVLSFCYTSHEQGAIPLLEFLERFEWDQVNCGLINIPHMKNVYGLYHGKDLSYKGVIQSDISNEVCLSSIPKGEKQVALLYFNKDGYSTYCKTYREYWSWVEKRNESRYQNTKSNGKNYDSKNMMHTFRLLEMAIEIAKEQKIHVRRPNRDFLLGIKRGQYDYEELLQMAEERKLEMETAFQQSILPENPNKTDINKLTYQLRDQLYQSFA